ncbi:MAG: hypothetical protein AB7Q00_14520 [Phycisphaerales bacterium]
MSQVATYWPPGQNDGFGGRTRVSAPVAILCRWSDKIDLVKNGQGREVVSNAQVHVDRALAAEGYLVRGDVTDEVDSDGTSDPLDHGAQLIINVSQVPSLDATEELHKIWL